MGKRFILAIIVLIALLLILEIISLFELKSKVKQYAQYWQKPRPKSGTLTYVALGDSAAQSVGASAPQLGYVGLLAKKIALKTGRKVRVVNLSVSGARVQDVINDQLPKLYRLRKVDLITLEIGANDVVHWEYEAFERTYEQLLALLPKSTVIANVPYFGGRIRRNAEARHANQIIQRIALSKGYRLVDLFTYTRRYQSIFNYASDLFHPNNRGYRNWCEAFWQIVESKLEAEPLVPEK